MIARLQLLQRMLGGEAREEGMKRITDHWDEEGGKNKYNNAAGEVQRVPTIIQGHACMQIRASSSPATGSRATTASGTGAADARRDTGIKCD